jgi:hypothetical protein
VFVAAPGVDRISARAMQTPSGAASKNSMFMLSLCEKKDDEKKKGGYRLKL